MESVKKCQKRLCKLAEISLEDFVREEYRTYALVTDKDNAFFGRVGFTHNSYFTPQLHLIEDIILHDKKRGARILEFKEEQVFTTLNPYMLLEEYNKLKKVLSCLLVSSPFFYCL